MIDLDEAIVKARTLLASDQEAKAVETLRDAIDATDDPELLRQIHEIAVEAHEHTAGFHKMEWHKLVVETEPHVGPAPDADVLG